MSYYNFNDRDSSYSNSVIDTYRDILLPYRRTCHVYGSEKYLIRLVMFYNIGDDS